MMSGQQPPRTLPELPEPVPKPVQRNPDRSGNLPEHLPEADLTRGAAPLGETVPLMCDPFAWCPLYILVPGLWTYMKCNEPSGNHLSLDTNWNFHQVPPSSGAVQKGHSLDELGRVASLFRIQAATWIQLGLTVPLEENRRITCLTIHEHA